MAAEPFASRLATMLRALKIKDKEPNSAGVLNTWISQAEQRLGAEARGGRLGWLIASSVAVAAVQRAVDEDGRQLFLLKGGTLLQHRLDVPARTTNDIDGLIRGDIESFLTVLDRVLDEPWGPFTLRRGEVEVIEVPTRVLKPRRLDIYLELRGTTWRRIQFELSPDEAGIGDEFEAIEAPPLGGFGLPNPEMLVGIALRHQIAQKLHAVTDPHDPPTSVNDRPRDVIDLLLLRDLAVATGSPTSIDIAAAAEAVFQSRAEEAVRLNREPRYWPPVVVSHAHWAQAYARAAASAGIDLPLDDAVGQVNAWVADLSR